LYLLTLFRDSALQPYVKAGWWIPKAIDPFVIITTVFDCLSAKEEDVDHDETAVYIVQTLIGFYSLILDRNARDEEYKKSVFRKIIVLIPGFDTTVNDLMNDFATLNIIIETVCVYHCHIIGYIVYCIARCQRLLIQHNLTILVASSGPAYHIYPKIRLQTHPTLQLSKNLVVPSRVEVVATPPLLIFYVPNSCFISLTQILS
jgi:hypothetical protein